MKFSIGYNYDPRMLRLLIKYRSHIEALYFPVPQHYMGSGRALREPAGYERQIVRIIRQCRCLGIASQLLLNPITHGAGGLSEPFIRRLIDYLAKLFDQGLVSAVVVNPVYMERIRSALPGLRIESSVNCFVRTVAHALYLKDIGVDVITIDRDINRNIALISAIKAATGLPVRIMLNEGCLADCPYRVMHYNYLSLPGGGRDRGRGRRNIDLVCYNNYRTAPHRIFRIPFIPPEELGRYAPVADHFKLSTRVFHTARIEQCLRLYIHRRPPENLLDILDCPGLQSFSFVDYRAMLTAGYFNRMSRCDLECKRCSYCEDLFHTAVLGRPVEDNVRNVSLEGKALDFFRKQGSIVGNRTAYSLSRLRMGEIYLVRGEYQRALPLLQQAYRRGQKGDYCCFLLGKCLTGLGLHVRALYYLDKLRGRYKDDLEVLDLRFRCLQRAGYARQSDALFDRIAGHVLREKKI